MYGASITLYASFLAVGVACALGIPIGLLAGFLGGWVDGAIGRLIDTLLSFPAIVLAIAVTGALGVGLTDAMLAIGIVFCQCWRGWRGHRHYLFDTSCTWMRRAASAPG